MKDKRREILERVFDKWGTARDIAPSILDRQLNQALAELSKPELKEKEIVKIMEDYLDVGIQLWISICKG